MEAFSDLSVQFKDNNFDEFSNSDKLKNMNNQIENASSILEEHNSSINNLSYNRYNFLKFAKYRLVSNLKRFVYTNTNQIVGLNDKIMNNGIYHFSDHVDQIIENRQIRSSGFISSYGNRKVFFFVGIPEVGAYVTNFDILPLITTAVKVSLTEEMIKNPKFKVRNLDDGSITYHGLFDLSNVDKSKEYMVLTKVNNKLVYQNVSEEAYNSYASTPEGKQIAEFLADKKNIYTIRVDYLAKLYSSGLNNCTSESVKKTK